MKRTITITAFALSLFAVAPAGAQSLTQLAASAGLTAVQAQGMTLNEIYVAKINRDSGREDRQQIVARTDRGAVDLRTHGQLIAAAGLSPDEAEGLSLNQIFALKTSANAGHDERQVVVSSRSGAVASAGAQLAAAAGLTPAEARGLSLNDLYVLKINREAGHDERQRARF